MALLLAALLPVSGMWRAEVPVVAWPVAAAALVVMLATLAVGRDTTPR